MWATQISHIPMAIDLDRRQDWPSLQVYIYVYYCIIIMCNNTIRTLGNVPVMLIILCTLYVHIKLL